VRGEAITSVTGSAPRSVFAARLQKRSKAGNAGKDRKATWSPTCETPGVGRVTPRLVEVAAGARPPVRFHKKKPARLYLTGEELRGTFTFCDGLRACAPRPGSSAA